MEILLGFIYKITNAVNGKVYIGQTSKTIEERFAAHIKKAKQHTNRYLYDAMNHYGYDKFKVSKIEECDDSLLDEREKYWIARLNCIMPNGYNMTEGGGGGDTWTNNPHKEETAMKLIVANRGKKRSKEFCDNLSKRFKGRKGSSDASKRAAETRKQHIIEQCGYSSWEERVKYQKDLNRLFRNRDNFHHTEETKRKMSEFRLGKSLEEIYGEETARKIREGRRERFSGENNPLYHEVDRDILLEKILNHEKVEDIAKYFKCSTQTIYNKCNVYFGTRKTTEVRNKYVRQKQSANVGVHCNS